MVGQDVLLQLLAHLSDLGSSSVCTMASVDPERGNGLCV